jgi:hypothetical protein
VICYVFVFLEGRVGVASVLRAGGVVASISSAGSGDGRKYWMKSKDAVVAGRIGGGSGNFLHLFCGFWLASCFLYLE